jgi:hypothetical protein
MGISTIGDHWPGKGPAREPAREPASLDRTRVCARTNKTRHARKQDALTHLRSLAKAQPDADLGVYVCRTCFSWHVGNKTD